ncbi:elongation factor Ts [Candidatus Dojkabacteria bacterium]|jgi:elongation factor Ts|nr:elongation factor Ts [Candidatus Dojkabacteria bacterium]
MKVNIEDIKTLREKTSAGVGLCKEALEQAKGDMAKAIEFINKKSDAVSRLRDLTGAKIGFCKIALEDSDNDFQKAADLIKERGWDNPVAAGGEKKEGTIDVYLHGVDRKLFSAIEVTCKTDFVARNDQFKAFVHELALQVAATKPRYIAKEDVPAAKLKEQKILFKKEMEMEKKPAKIAEKIVEGKLAKFYEENCLLEQKWFKDESKTMRNLLDETQQKLGEPLTVTRIIFWELGK